MFSPTIDVINKITKVVMEVMDHIYFMQLEIEECCMKIEEHIIKVQLEYYKHQNKKNPQDKQGYGHNFFSS
jgi:FtsZ-binding cell division protein ZapB